MCLHFIEEEYSSHCSIMSLKSYGNYVLLAATFGFLSYYLNNYYVGAKKKHAKRDIHEVITFYQNDNECKKSKYSRCMITKSMDRLLYYVSSPRYSIDICMYVFTNLDLMNTIIKLHYKGIKLRIITDADMAYTSGSCIRKLEKLSIPVRWMKSTNLMHHKFCLIDTLSEEAHTIPLVVTGSLNWTNQALYGNWENVIVTSQTEIISRYKAEYERLWTMFKPVVDF